MATPIGMTRPAQAYPANQFVVQRAGALTLPANFIDEAVVTQLAPPRAFTFAPDGRIFIVEAGDGTNSATSVASVRVFKNGQLLAQPAITLDVCGDGERGLLGIALDPNFASNGHLYLYYTRPNNQEPWCGYSTFQDGVPGPRNRVSRFTMVGDTIASNTERVLIDSISTDNGMHNAGDLHFGPDGYLYISTGESGLAYLAQEKNNLNGKILRIKPLSGDAGGYTTDGNPYDTDIGDPSDPTDDAQLCGNKTTFGAGACREQYARGFRNPFRFAVQPDGNNIFVGDVGGGGWEEIDKLKPRGNYGWPAREGPCPSGVQCGNPPYLPSDYDDPVYAYSHFVSGVRKDSAVTGGTFIPPNSPYPSAYDGDYVIADGYQGFMRRLKYDGTTDTWLPVTPDFATNAFAVISLRAGPDGNLYYLTFDASPGRVHQLRRIRYALAENFPPVPQASVTPVGSPDPNAIYTFSAAGSSDPDNNLPLSYQWNFGDGVITNTTGLTVTHQYATLGAKTVTLKVTDSGTPPKSVTTTLQVFPGNTAPVATINVTNTTSPTRGQYYAGDVWDFGIGTLSDDAPLPANALTWSVVFHHDTHTHPFLSGIAGNSGQFTIPKIGETDPDVWYRVQVDVTDAQGLMSTFYHDVLPVTTTVSVSSIPSGAQLSMDGAIATAPFTQTRVVGVNTTLNVISPTQQFPLGTWTFARWSDGGAAFHNLNVLPDQVIVATFNKAGPSPFDAWLPFVGR
jgi:glucose/arabinose dehydrogenase